MSEIVPTNQRAQTIEAALRHEDARFALVLPDFMKAQKDRFLQLAIEAAHRPDIMKCEPQSIIAAVAKAAQCGLPIDGTHAALVPYFENGSPRAQFIPMVQGLIVTAMRNGGVRKVWSAVVYEGDDFSEVQGSDPKLEHKPMRGNRTIDKALCVYACAKLQTGDVIFEVMDREQVTAIKNASKAKKGPWSSAKDEPEMWRKTAVRRLAKYMPKSPDLQAVLDADEEFEPLEPREPEYNAEPSPTNGSNGARTLAELVPKAEPKKEPTKADPPTFDVTTVRWHKGIEIMLADAPAKWLDQTIGGKGVLNGMTYRSVAASTDEAVVAEVERILAEGAAIHDREGTTAAAYQKLAEACRLHLAAGPFGETA